MLRLDETIRLTAAERETLSTLVGTAVNPTTVAAHNGLLDRAQALFSPQETATGVTEDAEPDETGTAESRLMLAVLEQMRLPD